MGFKDWLNGINKLTPEKTPKEKSPLELQLENIAEHDHHHVEVSVIEEESLYKIIYNRRTDQSLIDKITALPLSIRTQRGWIGDDYLETLSGYIHPINLEIIKVADHYGGLGCPRQDGFFMNLNCRSPIGLNGYEPIQLSVNLGQFSENDCLSAPQLICSKGNLTMRLFYRGNHQQLDQQFVKRIYEAFETVYDTVSIPAELNRHVDATKQPPLPHSSTYNL